MKRDLVAKIENIDVVVGVCAASKPFIVPFDFIGNLGKKLGENEDGCAFEFIVSVALLMKLRMMGANEVKFTNVVQITLPLSRKELYSTIIAS